MFGQQNDITTRDQKADINVTLPDNAIAALANDPAVTSATDSPAPPVSAPAIDDSTLPGAALAEETVPANIGDASSPAADLPTATLEPVVGAEDSPAFDIPAPEITAPAPDPSADRVPADAATNSPIPGNLLNIKQEALEALSPLVGQLELGPEEKFRTLMMLIQASDNRDLVPEAYDAAKQISDEKARAQALLDIVNEINYFTRN